MNSDKSTAGLLYFCIFSMLTKFKDDQRVMGWWCNRVTLVRVTPDITLNNVTLSVTLSNVTLINIF